MLDVLAQQNSTCWHTRRQNNEPGFPQSLPDVACTTTMDDGIAFAAHININKIAIENLECLAFDRQLAHLSLAKSLTGLYQGAESTVGRCRGALQGTEIHDGLIIYGSLRDGQVCLRQLGKEPFALRGIDRRVDTKMA